MTMNAKKLERLIRYLAAERGESDIELPDGENARFRLYRGLVNTRPAEPADEEFIAAEDEFLTEVTRDKGITDIDDLSPAEDGIYLWQGDITTLRCGAIVNAANSGMTGCWAPCHSCIDNCIHTFAGVRLRIKCSELMRAQGHEEPTGSAKLTPAYSLPSRYVIHTVGPIVSGRLTQEHCRLLESSYKSCLELAASSGVESIAFCCISTGVFGFPKREAAHIAVTTVRDYLKTHDMKVVFNVFSDEDRRIYEKELSASF